MLPFQNNLRIHAMKMTHGVALSAQTNMLVFEALLHKN